MKHLILAVLLVLSGQASAVIVENIHLDFQSGASYDGTITFNDGYEGIIDTDGLLTGGTNNFNEHFSWSWWAGTGQTNPNNLHGLGYVDWLINGTEGGGDYTQIIGLTWDATASVFQGGLSLVDTNNAYTFGISASDAIVGWRSSSVPESSGVFLLGLGLLGLVARRKLTAK